MQAIKEEKQKMKRGRFEIMAQILLLCSEAKRKTRILYQTNLSYLQLKNYINVLTSKNLLAHKSDSYVTTDKGHRFLEAFALLNDLLDDRTCRTFTVTVTESHEEVEIVQLGSRHVKEHEENTRTVAS